MSIQAHLVLSFKVQGSSLVAMGLTIQEDSAGEATTVGGVYFANVCHAEGESFAEARANLITLVRWIWPKLYPFIVDDGSRMPESPRQERKQARPPSNPENLAVTIVGMPAYQDHLTGWEREQDQHMTATIASPRWLQTGAHLIHRETGSEAWVEKCEGVLVHVWVRTWDNPYLKTYTLSEVLAGFEPLGNTLTLQPPSWVKSG
jgi:hypothetical protein